MSHSMSHKMDVVGVTIVTTTHVLGYENLSQPHSEKTVLTKPKIFTVAFEWLRVEERRNRPTRYVMSAATYQRLVEAVRPHGAGS